MPVSIGPLGNQQVRVEDFVTVQSASAAGAGTRAVNTVSVNASGGAIRPGSYWRFNGPEAPADKPNVPVRKYHVWYEVTTTGGGTLGVDPLPQETNQVGIKVPVSSAMDLATVASNSVSAINAYFAGPNLLVASATRSSDDILVSNIPVGPALCEDGIGSRASGLSGSTAASTGFTFASTVAGVAVDTRSFEVASAIQASGATAASVFSLLARNTGSTFSVAADAEVTRVVCPDVDTNIAVAGSGDFFQLRGRDDSFYCWFSASDGIGGEVTTDPTGGGSGTAIPCDVLQSGDGGALVATSLASSINAQASASFTAVASAAAVTITAASAGAVEAFPTSLAAASDVNASVTVTQDNQGGGDWAVTRSNRFIDPSITLESDNS